MKRTLLVGLAALVAPSAALARVESYAGVSTGFYFSSPRESVTGFVDGAARYDGASDEERGTIVFLSDRENFLRLRPLEVSPDGTSAGGGLSATGTPGARSAAVIYDNVTDDVSDHYQMAEAVTDGPAAKARTSTGKSWFFTLTGGDVLGIEANVRTIYHAIKDYAGERGSATTTVRLAVRDSGGQVLERYAPADPCLSGSHSATTAGAASDCEIKRRYEFTAPSDGRYRVDASWTTTATAGDEPAAVPAPGTMLVLGFGVSSLGLVRRR